MPARGVRHITIPIDKFKEEYNSQLDTLAARLAEHGLELNAGRKETLYRFALLIAERAQEFNLVSRGDLERVIDKHVGASLGPLLYVKTDPRSLWVDIGSGAGLPGMVLKAWEPEQPMLFVESSGKRCLFLEEAGHRLGLGVAVKQARCEELSIQNLVQAWGGAYPIRHFVYFMRAVDPLLKASSWVPSLMTPGDLWLFYTGIGWEKLYESCREELEASSMKLIKCLEVPWSPGRILIFEKDVRE
ncbi:MAG: class I SAM-dependent methyltransferase [Candidatus Eisenbacteria bacterium]|uniref:Ribosomal RNA small subunit methyltransferase G n=1 Tax=Eiseniibacteriota bacterium TaxID=2212470 RepID=A0A948RYT2_UNCEI|nr:class I SAM-dependent methyltransferase [Candidatus Eisenbacteria bacterium]MBU1947248.1 class I SAM-dependent methyltransferase [Candidatus Eisenbacteria bacterium]MBU2693330.1 class I SAM-dependent methyltransferase [Candidatus Eisenbacteria bacterium]